MADVGTTNSRPNRRTAASRDPSWGEPMKVVITGIDVSFTDLMNLIFRSALASIPAMFLLAAVFAIVGIGFSTLFAGGLAALLGG